MLDMFKRASDERHPPEELQIPLEPEAPFQVRESPEITEAKEAPPEEPVAERAAPQTVEENLTALLQTLKQEESALMSQKERLVCIEEQLRLRTQEEIEKTKVRISDLKSEIPELKQKCEAMAKNLEIPVYNTSD
jgi:predicted RNase H-like nuclease (RuvC/YqgF family)